MYKKNTVKVSYGREGYSKRSGGGYSGVGHGGGDTLDSGGYTSDDVYGGYSGTVSYGGLLYRGYSRGYGGGYATGYQVSSSGYNASLYKVRRGYGKRVYAKQGDAKRLLWTRYDKNGGGYIKKASYRKENWLYKRRW